MLYHMGDSQHTQNIQINKVIGKNEKCVFHFMEKTYGLFGQPNNYLHLVRLTEAKISQSLIFYVQSSLSLSFLCFYDPF